MMEDYFDVESLDREPGYVPDSERSALLDIRPEGFTIRHPPKPHELDDTVTHDDQLFQTIHMGAAVVDDNLWRLVIDGMVQRPIALTLAQLKAIPSSSVMTFHECYGSPLKPPTTPLWRVGNVRWTGVPLATLLDIAKPKESATFVWSEGLEHGTFAEFEADRYQKDLPIEKAVRPEVLLAYEMNGESLTKERGFPVRLVVPGWFGTNSTKWICHISLQDRRASSPFTTELYNEVDPQDPTGKHMRPVWAAEVNSMICRPKPGELLDSSNVLVWGRAWGNEEVIRVEISIDGGQTWQQADIEPRKEFEWQLFRKTIVFSKWTKHYRIIARAIDKTGNRQPLTGRRNHVHAVEVSIAGED